jgi:hypothetical protein
VFAVVQHQHGPFGAECRSQLTAVSAADPAETESVRDRRHDTAGIERGGQRHPAHPKVSIGSQLPGNLDSEPRLACTADTADRDHTRRSEQVGELGAFPLASNEPSEIGRQRVPEELGIDRHDTPQRSFGSVLATRTYAHDRTGAQGLRAPPTWRTGNHSTIVIRSPDRCNSWLPRFTLATKPKASVFADQP